MDARKVIKPITQFGFWDADLMGYIQAICSKEEEQARLKAWFYVKGIQSFQSRQKEVLDEYVSCSEDVMPQISLDFMLMQKTDAFVQLYEELKNFLKKKMPALLQAAIEHQMSFRLKALNHEDFFKLQAEITTALHDKINQGVIDKDDAKAKGVFVMKQFSLAKEQHPELASQIDAHLQLMKEYAELLRSIPSQSESKLFVAIKFGKGGNSPEPAQRVGSKQGS